MDHLIPLTGSEHFKLASSQTSKGIIIKYWEISFHTKSLPHRHCIVTVPQDMLNCFRVIPTNVAHC
ncbi:hypothetical protein Scep_023641 [Stephania cephalantha]|uniref:Uncharacterized protein n=1 Tax=Stephania cephalantha TaxID=152367 RepID=A0AAP0EW27_9MAGN